ncbi:MAG TPA: cytochrome b/b6 domain-containing protein [Ramlibacter sp.]|nr:cytochrome b/b6 domain-containing protein [Ramlibacter sp.]
MDPDLIYRHRLPVRVMHWINVICIVILLGSGLQIFNAHPALYWGHDSRDATLVLQLSKFPGWATIPSSQWLAMGRVWHFFFAWLFVINGLAYVLYTIFSGHLRRDLVPTRSEWRGIGRSIVDHLKLKHPHGDEAKRYNVLQNIAYLSIVFIVLPLIVLGGWAMSPLMDSIGTGWVDFLGGRQAARTLHFAAAVLIVAFVLVHVFEVIVTGVVNNLRSMITGYWRLPK